MPQKIIYAAFHPEDGRLLGLGVANSPLSEDAPTLHRMNYRFGGIPDVLILATLREGVPWVDERKSWTRRVTHAKNTYADKAKNDATNLREQRARWGELLEGREYITGPDLLSRRRQVLVPLPRSRAPVSPGAKQRAQAR